jgi:YD repeat-containing protein
MVGIATAATITTTYQYDPLGRLTGEQHSTGMVITYAYDANGNRTGRVVSVTLPQFSATPVTGNSPLTVAFSDLSTGNITSWLWDFGDGGTSAVQNPGYTYNIPGTYTVTLTLNGSFTLTKTLYIAVNPVLTVSLTGSGGGSVNSDIAGIACTFPPQAGNCAAGYPPTTGTVTLSAAPNTDSIFGGWSGACTNLTGKCPVPLTTNNSAGAIFTYVLPVQLFRAPPVPYSSFLTAYTAALPGEIIQARSVDLGETLILNNGITVSFKGGYDSTFTTQGGVTTVKGITIQQGTLIVDHMVIK